jgi:hypothetical protein
MKKIFIGGSMHFSKKMLEVQKQLQKLGYEALVPTDTHECLDNPNLNMDVDHCTSRDIDKENFDLVVKSDAFLVLNYPKNNIDGYIGGATLMEIGLCRHFNIPVILLHSLPSKNKLRYSLEVEITKPYILNGNIENILECIN